MYEARVVEDTLHPNGRHRMTTMEVVLPRPFLAELNTHCRNPKNSESSRAKGPEHRIRELESDIIYVPVFEYRAPGMAQEPIPEGDPKQLKMQRIWREAAADARFHAKRLMNLRADKSHVNRLLEPFVWQRVLMTGDTWSNFLALRLHKTAAPEMQEAAAHVRDALDASEPRQLRRNGLHVPYVSAAERRSEHPMQQLRISAGRCARISYDRTHEDDDPIKSVERQQSLYDAGHMSPFQFQAWPQGLATRLRPLYSRRVRGQFEGPWVMWRKILRHEDDFAKILKDRET